MPIRDFCHRHQENAPIGSLQTLFGVSDHPLALGAHALELHHLGQSVVGVGLGGIALTGERLPALGHGTFQRQALGDVIELLSRTVDVDLEVLLEGIGIVGGARPPLRVEVLHAGQIGLELGDFGFGARDLGRRSLHLAGIAPAGCAPSRSGRPRPPVGQLRAAAPPGCRESGDVATLIQVVTAASRKSTEVK